MIHQAKLAWIGLVGINREFMLIDHRISLAEEIAVMAKTRLSRGEIDVIRYHHAQMEFVNLKMEKTRIDVDRNSLQTRLIQLCGGKTIQVKDTAYPVLSAWSAGDLVGSFAGTPYVKSLENEINIRNLDKNIAVS